MSGTRRVVNGKSELMTESIDRVNGRTNADLRKAHAIRTEDMRRQAVGEAGVLPDLQERLEQLRTPTQANRITDVCDEVRDLLIRKNHDYGDSFSKQYAKYGVMSGLIRIDDKISRLDTLVGSEDDAQVAESVEDTVADLAGYAMLLLVELRKEKADA